MVRIIEENYYELAELNFLVKTGVIDWKPPVHNKPDDYGLTAKDAINSRIRYLRANLTPLINEFNAIKGQYLRGERPYGYIGLNSLQEHIDKLSKAISFNYARLRGDTTHQPFDLEAIKRVPIESITKVNTNGFFQSNPFRTEKEPSNSLYLYRNKNRWTDFGTSQSGDVIDLMMAKENCSFKEACKLLSSIT